MAPRRKKQKMVEDDEAVAEALAGVSDEFYAQETLSSDTTSKIPNTKNARSLFVRSLPEGTTSENLATFFSESYPLKHATIVTDRVTKKSKGFGFVTFADPEDAARAREEFDGSTFGGKKIKVEIAEPRHRDAQAAGATSSSVAPIARKLHGRTQELQAAPRLIIRNLPWSFKKPDQLTTLFRSYGTVKQATLPTQKQGLSSGFGFVLLRGRKNAEKAIAGLNGKEIDGRTITVDWAMDKTSWQALQVIEKKRKPKDEEPDSSAVPQALVNGHDEEETDGNDEDEDGGVHVLDDEDDEEDIKSDLDSDGVGVDELDEVEGMDDEEEEDEDENAEPEDYSCKLFVRNLPFTANDESLTTHFSYFGPIQYARVVMDHNTDRSRGTAFVCFRKLEDATKCLKEAPKAQVIPEAKSGKSTKRSILEDTQSDPYGHYTMDGRVLQLSKAVDRNEATRLQDEGQAAREKRDRDKRRLFLLSEGTISSKSPLYTMLSQTEIKLREDSSKQRQSLIKSNPLLHLSLTRLSVRNIPRHITSKDLKALAREAVVGFAKDVKDDRRQAITKEELSRGGAEMKQAEQDRRAKKRGIVTQAKIVFEGREGGKVDEKSGAGKSRGYGFIEYSSHRWALMGLRWLNGHLIKRDAAAGKANGTDGPDRARRLIVEFAIENAQVVARRHDRQRGLQDREKGGYGRQRNVHDGDRGGRDRERTTHDRSRHQDERSNKKRKAEDEPIELVVDTQAKKEGALKMSPLTRNIVGKKRAMRKARRS